MSKELITEYSNNPTQKRRAEIESTLWSSAPVEARQSEIDASKRRFAYLISIFPEENGNNIGLRSRLYSLGTAADPLWDRVETDMTLKTANDLAQEAKSVVTSNYSLDCAIIDQLKSYDARPNIKYLGDGKFVRIRGSATGAVKRAQKNGEVVKPRQSYQNPRVFWTDIRNYIVNYISEIMNDAGVPQLIQEELCQKTELELKVVSASLQSAIYMAKKQNYGHFEVSRKKVLDACQILGLVKPKNGQKINLDEANKRKKKLALSYHPDKHQDENVKQAMEVKFQEVIEAYTIVEEYNRNLENANV